MVNLNLKRSLFVPKFYPYLLDYSKRWEFWCGSAGSGKSFFLTQRAIIRCCNEKIRFVICRRYGSTLRNSVFALINEVLAQWRLTEFVKVKETDMSFTFPNGSQIILLGLDEETKLLSLANISACWVEEAYEVPQNMVEQLNLRMRGKAANQQIWLSWNPISKNSYLYDFTVANPPDNSIFIHSTFRDNPFLNQEYIDSLLELYERNPQKARVFCDGEWGVDVDGLVFRNWKIQDFNPQTLAASGLEYRCGSDIGYIDPTTIVCSLYDKDNKKIYVFDEFYKRGCQLDEVAKAMEGMELKRVKIWMDAAEPRTIDYFRKMGFNAVPCIKGADSVRAGIAFLQNMEVIIHPKCKNLINEFENFVYLKSKKTGQLTEDTDHEYSHGVDGLRYSYSNIYTNKQLKTIDKKLLGL